MHERKKSAGRENDHLSWILCLYRMLILSAHAVFRLANLSVNRYAPSGRPVQDHILVNNH